MSSVFRPSQASRPYLSGAIFRRAALLTCLTAFALGGVVSAVDFIDPDTAIYDRLDKVGNPSLSDEERRAESAALLKDEAWVQRAWRRISQLAIKARYEKPLPKRDASTSPDEPQKPKSETKSDDPLALPDKNAPENVTDPEYAEAVRARSQLGSLVRALTQLQDERVARLIGPLLVESGPDLSDEETMIPSPESIAAGTLSALLEPDGKVTGHPEETDIEGWRRWWAENKERFGKELAVNARLDERPADPEVEIVGLGAPEPRSASSTKLRLDDVPADPEEEIIGLGAPKRQTAGRPRLDQTPAEDEVEIIGRGAPKPKAPPAPRLAPALPEQVTPPPPASKEKPIIRAVPIERRPTR